MRLSTALNALVDANFAIVLVVARGDHEHFDRLVAVAEAKREAVATAGARYRRCLAQAGRGGEAEALAVDLAAALEPRSAVELADAASG